MNFYPYKNWKSRLSNMPSTITLPLLVVVVVVVKVDQKTTRDGEDDGPRRTDKSDIKGEWKKGLRRMI
jgi:hypothetical protein